MAGFAFSGSCVQLSFDNASGSNCSTHHDAADGDKQNGCDDHDIAGCAAYRRATTATLAVQSVHRLSFKLGQDYTRVPVHHGQTNKNMYSTFMTKGPWPTPFSAASLDLNKFKLT